MQIYGCLNLKPIIIGVIGLIFIESMSGRASPILQRVITMPIIIPCVTCMGYEKNNLNQSIPSDN